jgi:hypothetical protein
VSVRLPLSIAMTSPAIFRVGTRPQRPRELAYDSNRDTLRASVFDVALELGIGTSRAVENLIFDSVMEEDEEVSVLLVFACFPPVCPCLPVTPRTFVLLSLNGSCHLYDIPVKQSAITLYSICVQHSKCACPSEPRSLHCSCKIACHVWGIGTLLRSRHRLIPAYWFACVTINFVLILRHVPNILVSDYHFP